jgi:hypothetical protein
MKNRPTTRILGGAELQAAAADGVLTLREAYQRWTPAYAAAQLAARRWQRPATRVVVMHNGPLTPLQHRWVAVLAGPPGTVLGGLTAAADDGLQGFEPTEVSIVIPNSARMPSPPSDVRVMRSIELTARDVHPICVPPRTRMARSLVDAASDKASPPQRSRAVLIAGCQQGLSRPSALFDALSRRGPCRNRALIKETIADAAGGVESLPESGFDRLCLRAGLPVATRQRVLRHPDGRFYLDRYWHALDLCVEVHGVPHMAVRQWDADLDRQNEIVIAGPRLLVFSSFAVRHLEDRVIDQLTRFAGRWAA